MPLTLHDVLSDISNLKSKEQQLGALNQVLGLESELISTTPTSTSTSNPSSSSNVSPEIESSYALSERYITVSRTLLSQDNKIKEASEKIDKMQQILDGILQGLESNKRT